MNVLITGTYSGLGRAAAERFLRAGHTVTGIDLVPASILHDRYRHVLFDLRVDAPLPPLGAVHILVNSAGSREENGALELDLMALMRVTETYGVQKDIRSICNVAAADAYAGSPLYAAAKGGVLSYTKNVALRVAAYGATCNTLSPGGVTTNLRAVASDPVLRSRIQDSTLLRKWASPEEIAEWIFFLTVVNRSMTAQDVVVDNGEMFCRPFR